MYGRITPKVFYYYSINFIKNINELLKFKLLNYLLISKVYIQ